MPDKPILFSAPMVRAIVREIEQPSTGKTQTRRIVKPRGKHPSLFDGTWGDSYVLDPGNEDWLQKDIPIKLGDRLWVRETWQALSFGDYQPTKSTQSDVRYAATDPCADLDTDARGYPWRPSIFMPRWASRLTLTVTDVRVQRLQDISDADAIAEGIEQDSDGWRDYLMPHTQCCGNPIDSYRTLWDHINGFGAWEANPWIAAYSFRPILGNIDQIETEAA